MQCQEVQELLSAYLDGMLDPSEKDRADRHLLRCQACRSELEDFKMVLGLLRDLPPVDPPAQFRRELRNKLSQAAIPGRKAGLFPGLARGKWPGILAAAASFILVIGLAANWYGIPGKFGARDSVVRVESQVTKENAVKPGPAGSGEIRLDSGGALRQDTTSRVPGPAGVLSAQTGQGTQPERGAAAPASEPPVSLKGGNAPLPEDSGLVQGRKMIAAGNGEAGVAARGTAAASIAAGGEQPKQAAIEVRVEDRPRAVRDILSIAQKLGGAAAVLPGNDGREIILRVPGDQFEKAVIDIGKTGTVVRQDFPPYEKVDLLQSISQSTGVSPGALEIEKLGRGGGGPGSGETLPAGTAALQDGPKPDPAGAGTEIKKETFSAAEGGTTTATIRIRLE